MSVPGGTRIRAVYGIVPRPFMTTWPALAPQVKEKWAGQPGVRVDAINGNTIGFGIHTDEFFIDATTTAEGVDPDTAFPPAMAVQIWGQVYNFDRRGLTTTAAGERPPTPAETFGEPEWYELPRVIAGELVPGWLVLAVVVLVLGALYWRFLK